MAPVYTAHNSTMQCSPPNTGKLWLSTYRIHLACSLTQGYNPQMMDEQQSTLSFPLNTTQVQCKRQWLIPVVKNGQLVGSPLLPPAGNRDMSPGGNPLPLFISNPNILHGNQRGGKWSPTGHERLGCGDIGELECLVWVSTQPGGDEALGINITSRLAMKQILCVIHVPESFILDGWAQPG